MPRVHLNLHDRDGNHQGVARVLRYEGHMLVYDPHTNSMGWVTMKGIPASLTGVEAWSAEELGNFYPAPRAMRGNPQATWPPFEEVTVSHGPLKVETPKLMTGTVEANVDWDTDNVQDWSRSPSPSAGIGAITLGESTGDTPPVGQNTHLVTEHVIEPGVVPPQENAPEAGEKSPDDGNDAPSDEQQTELECEGDIVDLYMSTEEL